MVKPGVADHGRRLHELGRGGSRADALEQRVEGRVRHVVQLAVERRRIVRDREGPQQLARVVPVRGADLAAQHLAALERSRRRPLGRDARPEVVDVGRAAAAHVGALGQVPELALVGARPGLLVDRAHGVVGEAAAHAQPVELLGRLAQAQARVGVVERHRRRELGERRVRPVAERSDHRHPPAAGAAPLELLDRGRHRPRPRPAHLGLGGDPLRVRDVVVEVDEQQVALARGEHAQRLAGDRPAREPADRRPRPVRAVKHRVRGARGLELRGERVAAACHLRVAEARVAPATPDHQPAAGGPRSRSQASPISSSASSSVSSVSRLPPGELVCTRQRRLALPGRGPGPRVADQRDPAVAQRDARQLGQRRGRLPEADVHAVAGQGLDRRPCRLSPERVERDVEPPGGGLGEALAQLAALDASPSSTAHRRPAPAPAPAARGCAPPPPPARRPSTWRAGPPPGPPRRSRPSRARAPRPATRRPAARARGT